MIDTLQNVDESGVPVESRMPSANALRLVHRDFVLQDEEAARTRAKIKGLVDGHPPFSDKQLKNDGQAYRRNFNPRDAEAILDARCAADFNLAFDVQEAIEVRFSPGFFTDPHVGRSYAHKIAQAYTHVFKKCPRIAEAAQRAIRDKNEVGCGFLIFPNRFDFRPKGIMRGRVFFNPTASADCTDINEVTVIDTMTLTEIFELIEGGSTSSDAGWNLDALKRASAAFYYNNRQMSDEFGGDYSLAWEALLRRIRSNDSQVIARQHQTLPIVHGFIKERSGKVSQYMISQNALPEDAFLFESFEAVDSMSRLIVPMPFDFGDGTLTSVKGYGHRIFALATEAAKSLMRTLDAVDLASSFILQNNAGGDNLAFAMQRFGPVTLLDKGLVPIQTSFTPPVEPSMAAREMLLRVLNNNNGLTRPQMEDTSKRESVKTAEQVRYEGNREATYEKHRLFSTYLRWDALHREIFARLVDPACRGTAAPDESKEVVNLFWETCTALGVPEELLEKFSKHITVSATRSIGAGSTYSKLNNLSTARNMGLMNDMTERGRAAMSREIFSALAGYERLDEFFDIDGNDVPSNESTIANLEVNDFYEGTSVIVGVDQNHVAHINVKLAALTQEAQAFQQDPLSMDLERTVNLFQNGLPHVMRHIEILSGDPTREQKVAEYQNVVKQLMAFYQQVAPMFEEVQKKKAEEIERLRQENQQLQQSMSKENMQHEREMYRIQLQAEASRANVENLNQNRDIKQQGQLQMQIEKAGQALAIKQQQFQAEMSERFQKMQMDMAEAQVKIQAMLAKSSAAQRGTE